MHVIHHTEAVVLKSAPAGEANKRLWLYTREFGLIVALVQGVRKPEAKLRGHIGDYCFITADLVRGKEVWRLVSATLVSNPLQGKLRDPLARSYVRTLATMERFLAGEGHNEALFEHIEACAHIVREGGYDAIVFDTIGIWRTLVMLGYIAVQEDDATFFELPLGEALKKCDTTTAKRLIKEVQQAIIETHL